MKELFMVSGIAFIIALFLTPFVIRVSRKVGAMDIPKDNRRMHKKPIATLGGVAIYIAFLLVMLIKSTGITVEEIGIIIGGGIILTGGVIDDLKPLKPLHKLAFQLVAAIVVLSFGVSINVITNPISPTVEFLKVGILSIPFTIIWIIGITNSFNFIDGLDGLAAGVGAISSITMVVIAVMNGRYEAAVITAILSGALLGIIPYNFYPASIFIGDAGAQLIGFILASTAIMGAIKSAATFAVAIPILALGLPIYDCLFAIIRRKINGKPVSVGDTGHMHHRLMRLGMNQRQVVLILYVFSAILGIASIFAMSLSNRRAYFLAAIIVTCVFLVCLKAGMFKKEADDLGKMKKK